MARLCVPWAGNLPFYSRQEPTLENRSVRPPRGSLRLASYVCPSTSHKGIILVADDQRSKRELLSALMNEREGGLKQVSCAADGQKPSTGCG